MKKLLPLVLICSLTSFAFAGDRADDIARLESAATVLEEIMSAPDASVPDEVMGSAKCIAVVPSLVKGGFVLGASYGKGVASCRTDKGWSAPAFFRTTGGSVGFQIGGQAVDLVMLVMNDNGMKNLLSSKFKLGADASVAAGPVGRLAEGSTDWKMRAQVLTYSRARGVFAGVTLNGASIKQDKDDTREFYGRMVPFRTLLTGQLWPAPADAQSWMTALNKYAPNSPIGLVPAIMTKPAPPPATNTAPAKMEPATPAVQPSTPAPEQPESQPEQPSTREPQAASENPE
jgi:lipid-binding SYLF domain-containing protein